MSIVDWESGSNILLNLMIGVGTYDWDLISSLIKKFYDFGGKLKFNDDEEENFFLQKLN